MIIAVRKQRLELIWLVLTIFIAIRIIIGGIIRLGSDSKINRSSRDLLWLRRYPPNCRFVVANHSIAIKDCQVYQIGSILEVSGRVMAGPTQSANTLKRLIVQDIDDWRESSHSVKRGLTAVTLTAGRWRAELAHRFQSHLPPSKAAIADSLLFGDNNRLPQATLVQLRWAGLQHIIAASGFNVGLLSQAVRRAVDLFPRGVKLLVWLTVVGGYVLLAGASPSLLRASLMAGIQWVGHLWKLPTHALTALLISAGAMLLIYPWYLWSVSFQLSVLATLGIILFGPALESLSQPWLVWEMGLFPQQDSAGGRSGSVGMTVAAVVKESLVITLAAQLLVIPVIAWRFGQLAWLSPLTNVAVLWLVPVVTLAAGGWLVMAVLGSLVPGLNSLVTAAGIGLAAVLELLQVLLAAVGSWSGSVRQWQAEPWQLFAWYGAIVLGYGWWYRWRKKRQLLEGWRER